MSESILVAGIAGSSLGTDIIKSLSACGSKYKIYGCDISPYAYGHYMNEVEDSFVINEKNYVDNVLEVCKVHNISKLIPGSDITATLLGCEADRFFDIGVQFVGNNPKTIDLCSDKGKLFRFLKDKNVIIPDSYIISDWQELPPIAFPCIIKPATESGGSVSVFIVNSKAELELYSRFMLDNGMMPIVQEYMSHENGEFTVGVLHDPNGNLFASIALRRMFIAKVSIAQKSKYGLISSGYSQGYIDEFKDICETAEKIAALCKSTGPLNIQGRMKDGVFCPFEINPRFSASTHLRTLAGFNEIDTYIEMLDGHNPEKPSIKKGYYLRSFDETVVTPDEVKH